MRTLVYFAAAFVLLLWACNGSGTDGSETISREAFVEAYYKLRVAALRSTEMEIPIRARDRILAELGVTEEDLIRFAEIRGDDWQLMEGIWEEVDSLLRADRSAEINPGSEEPLDADPEPGVSRLRRPGGGSP